MSQVAVRTDVQIEVASINSVDAANYAIQHIIDANNAVTAAKDALKAAQAEAKRTEETYTSLLRSYFDSIPHDVFDKSERVSLQQGSLVLKDQAPEYKIVDEKAAINWCKANGMESFVKVTESLNWAGLKTQVEINGDHVQDCFGDAIPGISVINRERKFAVEGIKEVK